MTDQSQPRARHFPLAVRLRHFLRRHGVHRRSARQQAGRAGPAGGRGGHFRLPDAGHTVERGCRTPWPRDCQQAGPLIGFIPLIFSLLLTLLVVRLPCDPERTRPTAARRSRNDHGRHADASWLGGIFAYGVSHTSQRHDLQQAEGTSGQTLVAFRSGIASVLSQIVDTLIFITVAFYGVFPIAELLLGQMLAKVVLSVVLVPPLIYSSSAFGRRLGSRQPLQNRCSVCISALQHLRG